MTGSRNGTTYNLKQQITIKYTYKTSINKKECLISLFGTSGTKLKGIYNLNVVACLLIIFQPLQTASVAVAHLKKRDNF